MNLFAKKNQGFTLAELLIALGILGVIATFTIPKVLFSAQSGQNTAIAKEAASMVSGSYSSYGLQNGQFVTGGSGTTVGTLTQYMNYVAVDTTTTYSTGMTACSSALCLKLHNGGVLQMGSSDKFAGSATTNAVAFNIDPDGSGTATAATFLLYYNGRLTTGANATTGTAQSGLATVASDPSYIQNWN